MAFTGIPAPPPYSDIPQKLFRYGESAHWVKHVFEPGSTLVRHRWDYVPTVPVALEVLAVSWQLFTKNTNDLDRVLWECNLEWDFLQVKVPIGPLTQSAGGIGDHLFPESRGNLERLSETNSGLPSEEMWRILTQGNKIGDTYTFNGRMQIRKHPILIPASAQCGLFLYADNEVVFQEQLRIRVILHGIFKNVIEVG